MTTVYGSIGRGRYIGGSLLQPAVTDETVEDISRGHYPDSALAT